MQPSLGTDLHDNCTKFQHKNKSTILNLGETWHTILNNITLSWNSSRRYLNFNGMCGTNNTNGWFVLNGMSSFWIINYFPVITTDIRIGFVARNLSLWWPPVQKKSPLSIAIPKVSDNNYTSSTVLWLYPMCVIGLKYISKIGNMVLNWPTLYWM